MSIGGSNTVQTQGAQEGLSNSTLSSSQIDPHTNAAWKKVLQKASRGVLVTISNETDYTFVRTKYLVPHGIWREEPPETIPPHAQLEFGTESSGFMTGTEATVNYRIENEPQWGELQLYWNNPFIGAKTHASSSSPLCTIESSSSSLSSLSTQLYYVVFSINSVSAEEKQLMESRLKKQEEKDRRRELTSTRDLFLTCSLCAKHLIFETKDYCTDCYQSAKSDLRAEISKKLQRLVELHSTNVKLRNESVKRAIERRMEILKLRQAIGAKQQAISLLQQKLQHTTSITNQHRADSQSLRSQNSQHRQAVKSALSEVTKRRALTANAYPLFLRNLAEQSAQVFKTLAQHRKYLIAELMSFMPINPFSETESVVVNIKLPNEFSAWPDLPSEVLAAALGYLVHMQNIMTAYLDVCLPYKMKFYGSRSKIWREGAVNKKYLLYKQDENEFRTALEMLNWNVVHLCISQGVRLTIDEHHKTLSNFSRVLRSPHLGSDGSGLSFSEEDEREAIPTRRKRTMSISSMPMPYASSGGTASTLSGTASTLEWKDSLEAHSADTDTPEKKEKEKEKDDDDFVVIESMVPTPSDEDAIANYEKAMLMS